MVNTPRSELVLDQKNQEISGTGEPVEWRILPGMSDYSETLGAME